MQAVEPVDHRSEDDEGDRRLEAPGEAEPEGGEAGAEADDGHEVRHEVQERQRLGPRPEPAEPPPWRFDVEAIALHQRTAPVRAGSDAARSASTVSPAIIACPSQTSGATPSGR